MANPFCDLAKLEKSAKECGDGNVRKGLETFAWQNFKSAKAYYHVSPAINAQRILNQGLVGKEKGKLNRSNKAVIWFFTDDSTNHIDDMASAVAYSLALHWHQGGYLAARREFAIFEIDQSVIENKYVLWDDVGEACAIASFGYSREGIRLRIPASHIRLVENRLIPDEWLKFSFNQVTPGTGSYKPNLKKRSL